MYECKMAMISRSSCDGNVLFVLVAGVIDSCAADVFNKKDQCCALNVGMLLWVCCWPDRIERTICQCVSRKWCVFICMYIVLSAFITSNKLIVHITFVHRANSIRVRFAIVLLALWIIAEGQEKCDHV